MGEIVNTYSFQQVAEFHGFFRSLVLSEYNKIVQTEDLIDFDGQLSFCEKQVQHMLNQSSIEPEEIKRTCRYLFNIGVSRLIIEKQLSNPDISNAFVTGYCEQVKASTVEGMRIALFGLQPFNQFSLSMSDSVTLFHALGKMIGATMDIAELKK